MSESQTDRWLPVPTASIKDRKQPCTLNFLFFSHLILVMITPISLQTSYGQMYKEVRVFPLPILVCLAWQTMGDLRQEVMTGKNEVKTEQSRAQLLGPELNHIR